MIICFEGVSCAGKSTLIREVQKCLADSVVIQELPEDFSKHVNLDDFCRHNDIRKCMDSISFPNGTVVLQDRGHASTLAYNYIQYKLGSSNEYINTLAWYYEGILNKNLVKPDIYIFIRVNEETVIDRANMLNRYKHTIAWYSKPDLGNQFYEYFFRVCEPDVPVIEIDGSKSLKVKVAHVLSEISQYET